MTDMQFLPDLENSTGPGSPLVEPSASGWLISCGRCHVSMTPLSWAPLPTRGTR